MAKSGSEKTSGEKASTSGSNDGYSGVSYYHVIVVALLALLVGTQLRSPAPAHAGLEAAVFEKLKTYLPEHFPKEAKVSADLSKGKNAETQTVEVLVPKKIEAYTHAHFPTHFGLKHLPTTQIDPVIEKYVRDHDVKQDLFYTNDPVEMTRWAQQLSEVFENGLPEDERFEIRFISKSKGYGLFAKVNVGYRQVVALYTGVITNNSISDYQWDYPSKINDENGNPLNLGVDSRFAGNWARFVNHADQPNVDSLYVPYKGVWQVVYLSNQFIAAGEEVTISYGDAYWTTREALEKVN